MTILSGAIAYREDLMDKFEGEINSWDLARHYEHPIACPKGCDKTYGLMVEINASYETAKGYVGTILSTMERECQNHSSFIRIKNG